MKDKKEKKESLIDEFIEFKLPKEEDRTPEKVNSLLEDLCSEVMELGGNDEDCCDDCEKKEETYTGIPNRDDFPEDVIPFIVVRKDTIFIECVCPQCQEIHQISIRKFEKRPYYDHICSKCSKKLLLKLDFEPKIITYVQMGGEK